MRSSAVRAGKTVPLLLGAFLLVALSAAAAWWLRGRLAPQPLEGGANGLSGRPVELLREAGFTVPERVTAAPALHLSGRGSHLVEVDFTQAELTLVYFWFSSCARCIAELPALAALARGYENRRLRV